MMGTIDANTGSKQIKNLHQHSIATMNAWKKTLEQVVEASAIKANVGDLSIEQLDKLPIFALIVVVKTTGMELAQQNAIKTSIASWLSTQANTPAGWQAGQVDEFDDSDIADVQEALSEVDTEADRLTEVLVLRYVLCPTSSELLEGVSQEKRGAIAHVIDEQLTQHIEQANAQIATQVADGISFDCHILPVSNLLQVHKVACFDMDSTLIEQEVIVELAKATGVGNKVNEITESAMRGEIDFSESFAQRLRLLHGTYAEVLKGISDSLTLSAGAKTTLTLLNAMGYHTVLVSGGFTFFAEVVADKLQIAEFHANELMISDNKVIGEAKLPIVDGQRKADLVKMIAKNQGVELSEVICIGDGANDLLMMAEANLGFAYRAKPIVQAKADLAVNVTGLEGVLYGLGYGSGF